MPSDDVLQPVSKRIPWNKGKLTGPKRKRSFSPTFNSGR